MSIDFPIVYRDTYLEHVYDFYSAIEGKHTLDTEPWFGLSFKKQGGTSTLSFQSYKVDQKTGEVLHGEDQTVFKMNTKRNSEKVLNFEQSLEKARQRGVASGIQEINSSEKKRKAFNKRAGDHIAAFFGKVSLTSSQNISLDNDKVGQIFIDTALKNINKPASQVEDETMGALQQYLENVPEIDQDWTEYASDRGLELDNPDYQRNYFADKLWTPVRNMMGEMTDGTNMVNTILTNKEIQPNAEVAAHMYPMVMRAFVKGKMSGVAAKKVRDAMCTK